MIYKLPLTALATAFVLGGPVLVTTTNEAGAKDPGRQEAQQYRSSMKRYKQTYGTKRPISTAPINKYVGDFPGGKEYHRIGLWDRAGILGRGYPFVPPARW